MVDPTKSGYHYTDMQACMFCIQCLRDRTREYDRIFPELTREQAEEVASIEYLLLGKVMEHLRRLDPQAGEAFDRWCANKSCEKDL